jgi:hypothetical protein
VTDKEIKRFERFMKLAQDAWTLDMTVMGRTRDGTPYHYCFHKSKYTNNKLKVRYGYDRKEHNPESALSTVFTFSRYVTRINGNAEFPLDMRKAVGGKIYIYNTNSFVKYFGRT